MKVKVTPLKILICDDDSADRKLLRTYINLIKDKDIVLFEACHLNDIQNALQRGCIDLVFMDVQMPGKSGMEWLGEIVNKQIAPVIMLTGCNDEEIAAESIQKGAVAYLPKNKLSSEKLTQTIDASIERWKQNLQSKADQEEMERLANYDLLTGLYNRRAIMSKLDEHIKCGRRYREQISLLMLDIDDFKQINDRYGHIWGDNTLAKVATLLRTSIRETDIAGRYGGDEFIIILPYTDLKYSHMIAERVRKTVQLTKIEKSDEESFCVTLSGGVSTWADNDDSYSLISRADTALYKAKNNGRNKIEAESSA
jgi:two-component system, cell cycle response regulator